MISAVVITRNEQDSITYCLKSLEFCDEIILVDDFSTDKTLKLARKFTKKIFRRKLNGSFSEQKNFGMRKAKHKWILFIDSDEIITKKLASEILKVTNNNQYQGYYIKRIDYFYGQKLTWGEFLNKKFIRLVKKGSGKWERDVHEYFNITGKTQVLKNPLKHYSHSSIEEINQKIDFYSTLNANYLYSNKEKGSIFDICVYPTIKFIQNYILKLGLLDGFYGLLFSLFMSWHSFLSRLKLYFLYRGK